MPDTDRVIWLIVMLVVSFGIAAWAGALTAGGDSDGAIPVRISRWPRPSSMWLGAGLVIGVFAGAGLQRSIGGWAVPLVLVPFWSSAALPGALRRRSRARAAGSGTAGPPPTAGPADHGA